MRKHTPTFTDTQRKLEQARDRQQAAITQWLTAKAEVQRRAAEVLRLELVDILDRFPSVPGVSYEAKGAEYWEYVPRNVAGPHDPPTEDDDRVFLDVLPWDVDTLKRLFAAAAPEHAQGREVTALTRAQVLACPPLAE